MLSIDHSKPHLNIGASTSGLGLTGFNQISGLGVDTEVLDSPDGSSGKIPGRTTYADITSKRGLHASPTACGYARNAEGTITANP